MTKARVICFEGGEGSGKTTQVSKLVEYLNNLQFKTMKTKEPGTPLYPVTNELRKFVLDSSYGDQITPVARELLTQAIRSIHLEKVIIPALTEQDYIIQDRGLISGLAYGCACGHDLGWLINMSYHLLDKANYPNFGSMTSPTKENLLVDIAEIYDDIIYFSTNNISDKLDKARQAKQEYVAGDFIEAQGNSFMENAQNNFRQYIGLLQEKTTGVHEICIDGKDIETVFQEVKDCLKMR